HRVGMYRAHSLLQPGRPVVSLTPCLVSQVAVENGDRRAMGGERANQRQTQRRAHYLPVAAHRGEVVSGRDTEVQAVERGGAIATAPSEDGVGDLRPGAQALELQVLAPLGAPLDHLSPPA